MKRFVLLLLMAGSGLCVGVVKVANADASDPPEIAIGERLFLETRFAHAYFANPDKAD